MPLTRYGKFIDIAADVISGENCKVWSFTVICPEVRMGHRCVIGSHVYIGRGTVLGDDVHIQDGCHLTDRMVVGNRVFFGPQAGTANDKHPRVDNPDYVVEPPIIEDDVTLCLKATILPGVRLGRGCVIGASAVVTKDVPPGQTWVGNPAAPLVRHRRVSSNRRNDIGVDWEAYDRLMSGQHPRGLA